MTDSEFEKSKIYLVWRIKYKRVLIALIKEC